MFLEIVIFTFSPLYSQSNNATNVAKVNLINY